VQGSQVGTRREQVIWTLILYSAWWFERIEGVVVVRRLLCKTGSINDWKRYTPLNLYLYCSKPSADVIKSLESLST
jgi:hypothetical protein